MARPPKSAVRLTPKEAHYFRALARRVRDASGLTQRGIAEPLRWDETKVKNALASERALLADTAAQILAVLEAVVEPRHEAVRGKRGLAPFIGTPDLLPNNAQRLELILAVRDYKERALADEGWLRRHRKRADVPPILAPSHAIPALVDRLLAELGSSPGTTEKLRQRLRDRIRRFFEREGRRMALRWFEDAEATSTREIARKSRKRLSARVTLDAELETALARGVLALAVARAYPNRKTVTDSTASRKVGPT
jgi:hypothetical protein